MSVTTYFLGTNANGNTIKFKLCESNDNYTVNNAVVFDSLTGSLDEMTTESMVNDAYSFGDLMESAAELQRVITVKLTGEVEFVTTRKFDLNKFQSNYLGTVAPAEDYQIFVDDDGVLDSDTMTALLSNPKWQYKFIEDAGTNSFYANISKAGAINGDDTSLLNSLADVLQVFLGLRGLDRKRDYTPTEVRLTGTIKGDEQDVVIT